MRDEILVRAKKSYATGVRPSEVLREAARSGDDVGTNELITVAEVAFGLRFEDVTCIGGWWWDGSGELDDDALDRHLLRAIAIRRQGSSAD